MPLTVATEVLLLSHVPPPTPSLKDRVVPTHSPRLPDIAETGKTVTVCVETHVPPREYVIVVVPPLTPVT
jgi:hypothetical protein